jgi:hypothetical protein
MSDEPVFQINLGSPDEQFFINLAAGVQVKFPLKFMKNLMLEPYLAGYVPLRKSAIFREYPVVAVGGGFQLGLKAGNSGAVFIDANYTHGIGDAVRKNPYMAQYENPPVFHYQRAVINLGIGYKYGFFDRH